MPFVLHTRLFLATGVSSEVNKKISFAAFFLALAALPLFSQTSADNPRLKKALELFPEADADKDGVLTMAEARAFKKKGTGQRDPGNARPEEESIDPESLKPLLELYEAREFEGVKFKLLDAMAEEFPIDTDRVYVLGHSMGGFGTWTAVTQDPDRFAAAIPSAGWIGPWVDVTRIKDLPMWAFQGAKDKEIQTRMGNSTFARMQQLGHNLKFTEMANRGHNVSGAAFVYTGDSPVEGGLTKYASDQCDKTADVWDWLFKQKRGATTVRSEEKPDAAKAAEETPSTEVPVSRKGRIKGQDGEKRGARLEPTHADVSYGDHIRQKFDVWLPEGKSGPVPVHVYFHGGGFVGGKKNGL